MNVESARRVMETTCPDTANQYLRFGWKLINQYVVEATADAPTVVKYVLASVSRLDDTRQVMSLADPAAVNEYLRLGWKLIDKHVTTASDPQRRDETLHFVVAWQSDEEPLWPGASRAVDAAREEPYEIDDELC